MKPTIPALRWLAPSSSERMLLNIDLQPPLGQRSGPGDFRISSAWRTQDTPQDSSQKNPHGGQCPWVEKEEKHTR